MIVRCHAREYLYKLTNTMGVNVGSKLLSMMNNVWMN